MTTRICYVVDDSVQAAIDGKEVMALLYGVWYLHPDNEQKFIDDSMLYGFEAVRLPEKLNPESDARVIDWPQIT